MPQPSLSADYGTIGYVSDHRIRLSDEDIAEILAALRARLAMRRGIDRQRTVRLIARLEEGRPGNPWWYLPEFAEPKS